MIEEVFKNGEDIVHLYKLVFAEYKRIAELTPGMSADDVRFSLTDISGNFNLNNLAKKAKVLLQMNGWLPAPGVSENDLHKILILLGDAAEKIDNKKVDELDKQILQLLKKSDFDALRALFDKTKISYENTEEGIVSAALNKTRSWSIVQIRKAFDP